ncbi:hypothetical protein GC102_35205 [Paenibacillus sp. LMG 31460]|uniref:PglD N-terminal domain-containing protein n=1 Tax=Paenibacillus germinis TaxID=2654979 RepID=A0ABX1ZFA1_9BACL|nr:hypothetical protein [Paenibacillus germinis]NOU90936.1 hypothetical protein [Paenibacillus germinis]
MNKPILIYGTGTLAKLARQLAAECGRDFAGYIDDYHSGAEVVGTFEDVKACYPAEQYEIVIGIGYTNLAARWAVYEAVREAGYASPSLIHPQALVSETSRIGHGCMIMRGAVVDTWAEVEDLVVMWPGSVLNHESMIGSNTFLSPNCTICGFVTIGRHCFLGAGSIIVNHQTVPSHSFIKAGRLYFYSTINGITDQLPIRRLPPP